LKTASLALPIDIRQQYSACSFVLNVSRGWGAPRRQTWEDERLLAHSGRLQARFDEHTVVDDEASEKTMM
jgi:hypothetical protein